MAVNLRVAAENLANWQAAGATDTELAEALRQLADRLDPPACAKPMFPARVPTPAAQQIGDVA